MKKRLFYSNLLMVLLPVACIFLLTIFFAFLVQTVFLPNDTLMGKARDSLTQLQQTVSAADFGQMKEDQNARELFMESCGELVILPKAYKAYK